MSELLKPTETQPQVSKLSARKTLSKVLPQGWNAR